MNARNLINEALQEHHMDDQTERDDMLENEHDDPLLEAALAMLAALEGIISEYDRPTGYRARAFLRKRIADAKAALKALT